MSKAQLKKNLMALTKEQVVDVVLALYDARKEAKEYLTNIGIIINRKSYIR